MEGTSDTPMFAGTPLTGDSSIGTTPTPTPPNQTVNQPRPPLPPSVEEPEGVNRFSGRKNKSKAWEHFERVKNPDGTLMLPARSKFWKYWGQVEDLNKILLIAVLLDPRYKFLYLEYFFPNLQSDKALIEVMIEEVKSILMQLYTHYGKEDPAAAEASLNATQPRIEASSAGPGDEDSHAQNLRQFKLLRQEKVVVEIKNEVDKYLLEALEDLCNDKFDVLCWWKENAPRYPILSQVAKDVFAVPASTVASESAFSLGKRVVDPFRSSLTPRMVEALVCMSDWLKAAGFNAYKEPSKDELELYDELEKMESGVTQASDDED